MIKKRKIAHIYQCKDYVMVRNFDSTLGASGKLKLYWKGLYEVVKPLRNDRYVLKDIENHQITQRPYIGTWEASNMRPSRNNYTKDN